MKKITFLFLLTMISFTIFTVQSCTETTQAPTEEIATAADYFNQNKFEEALTAANELLDESPEDYFVWTIKGRSLFSLDKQSEGIEAITKAIEINPEYAKAFAYRASMYHATGESEKAFQDVNVAIKADKTNGDLFKLKTNIFYALGEYEAAIAGFTQVLKASPEDAESWVFRAIANQKLKKYDTVLSDFEKGIAANPKYSFAYQARADFYTYTLGDNFEQAAADYTKAIDLLTAEKSDGTTAFLYNNRGFAKYQLKDFDAALQDINKSIELFSDNAYAYKNRALVYLSKKDNAAMCKDLQKAKALKFEEKFGQEVNNLLTENCK